MQIKYINNLKRGPGHGYLLISGEPLSTGSYSLSCQRAVDQLYLNADGEWQEYGTNIELLGQWEPSQGILYLPLPPTIVDSLNTSDNYKIYLFSKDTSRESLKGRLKIQEIIYTPGKALNSSVILPDDEKPKPKPEPEPTPPPPPPPPVEEVLPVQTLTIEPEPAPKKRVLWPIILVAILLLALLGYIIWDKWLKPPEPKQNISTPVPALTEPKKTPEKNSVKDLPTQASQPQLAPKSEDLKAPAPKMPAPKPLTINQQVREFFRNPNRTPAKAADLAKTINPQTPEDKDAVFRLYYFAVSNGDKAVIMPYAACLDPSKPDWGTINKNGAEAYHLYQQAGTDEARAASANLKAWLEKAKKEGNRKAAAWLDDIEKKK